MTDRITVSKTLPSTIFYLEADRISQSIVGNYTTVRCYLRCYNSGNTTSYSDYAGTQTGSIDGIGTFGVHSGTPFLPIGVPTGQRWRDGPWDVNIPHNADGTRGAVTLRQTLVYDGGGVNQANTASFDDFPDIPRGPRVKVAGAWKNTVAYVKVAGAWVIGIPYVKKAGAWVLGGN